MKKLLFAVMLAGLCSLATAQVPSVSYLYTIPVGSVGTQPYGIDFYSGSLYTASFGNRYVLKTTNPISPSLTTTTVFADMTGSQFAWAGGRGTQSVFVDQSNGNVYAVGDTGTNGAICVYDQTGTTLSTVIASAVRLDGGALYGSGKDLVMGKVNSSTLIQVANPITNPTFTILSTSPLAPAGPPTLQAPIRDLVMDVNTIYYTHSANLTADSVAKVIGGSAGGDMASYISFSALYTNSTNQAASPSYEGLSLYSYPSIVGAKKYIVFADNTNYVVKFINTTNGAADVTVTDATNMNSTAKPYDAVVGNIAGKDYLFVSTYTPSNILVYGIDGASAVNDWMLY